MTYWESPRITVFRVITNDQNRNMEGELISIDNKVFYITLSHIPGFNYFRSNVFRIKKHTAQRSHCKHVTKVSQIITADNACVILSPSARCPHRNLENLPKDRSTFSAQILKNHPAKTNRYDESLSTLYVYLYFCVFVHSIRSNTAIIFD